MTLADALSPGWWAALPLAWAVFVVTAADDRPTGIDAADVFLACFPFLTAALARCLP